MQKNYTIITARKEKLQSRNILGKGCYFSLFKKSLTFTAKSKSTLDIIKY